MSSTQRIILTNEDDDQKVDVETLGSKGALDVAILDSSGTQIDDFGGDSGSTSVGDGTKTITTAGVRVQLSTTSVPCKRVIIQAHESNNGTVVVGGATVVAVLGSRRGNAIFPTQSEDFKVSDLNLLYIDSTASADKVNFYYEV